MNEIEKMYENVGVKKYWNSTPYGGIEEYYPPFTTEKQIELIKWLSEVDCTVRIDFDENEWGVATENYGGYFCDNFSDALASIINDLWQDLTEEEHKQIKEILQ